LTLTSGLAMMICCPTCTQRPGALGDAYRLSTNLASSPNSLLIMRCDGGRQSMYARAPPLGAPSCFTSILKPPAAVSERSVIICGGARHGCGGGQLGGERSVAAPEAADTTLWRALRRLDWCRTGADALAQACECLPEAHPHECKGRSALHTHGLTLTVPLLLLWRVLTWNGAGPV
jgi:hypothetical protein